MVFRFNKTTFFITKMVVARKILCIARKNKTTFNGLFSWLQKK